MAVYSTHNKYVSIPDWFTSQKKDASEKTAISTAKQTVVVGGSSSGVSSGTGVSEINLYNKFVLTEVSLDKDALVNENVAIIAVKSEINNVGDLLTANGWYTTEYISIAANSLMTITASVHDNYGLVFYDNTKTVISGTVFTQSPQDVQVPKNAVYYRISSNAVESFSILYFIENAYSSEQLEQSNSNIEDYLYLDASIPEGCNTVTFTNDSFNLLVQKPLSLTKDKNNIIKLSLPQSLDGVWELKIDENTQESYIFTKYPVVTQYGVTMYADLSKLNLPDIYAGLPTDATIIRNENGVFGIPIDNTTIVLENGKLTVVGGTGSDVATEVAWTNVKGKPSWLEDDKVSYAEVEGLANELKKYVTIAGNEEVTGIHPFVNGLKIGSLLINQLQDKDVVYIDGHLAVKGGITMYVDNGTVDLPNLYDGFPTDGTIIKNENGSFGIPIDNSTIVLSNGKLMVVGGTGGSGAVTEIAWNNVKGKPSWLNDNKISYLEVDGLTDQLDKYIPISDYTEVTGEKNFTGGLKVNGNPIVYDKDNKYWKLDGDLLITGAVTMFANEGTYTPSTIMDAISVDGTTIMNDGTKLYINPNLDLGGGLDESELNSYLTSNKYLTQTTGDARYITAIGTSGNSLTYTKNGTTQNVTVPYATSSSKLSTTSAYKAWGQTYWNNGVPASVSGNMTGVGNISMTGSINSAVTINSDDDSSWIKGSGHKMYFGGTGYANQSYYFRPLYGASGATTSNLYIQNASASSSPTFTTTHSFLSNGNASHAGTLTINGIELSKSKDDVLFIDANLVVRGAVTMYGTNSITASTIMDGILVDGTTIIKDPTTKKLMLNPDLELGGGGGINSLKVMLGSVEYNGVGTTDVVVRLPAYPSVPTSLKNPNKLKVTLADGKTEVEYDGSSEKSFALTRLYKASEVTTATSDEGTITPYAMNQWTTGKFPLKDGTGASGTWGISINGNLYNNSTGDKLGLGTSQPYFYDASANSGAGKNYNLLHRGLLSTSVFGDSYLDTMVQYTINATSLSTSNYYPIIFSATPKMMRVSMYSQTGSSSAAYNCNSLDFSFRGQGWTDVPPGLTVHHYSNYTASEKTIGCIGMGQEAGEKVVWVRGGLTYYISSNVTPTLKTANYTSGGQIYTVGTNEYGGTNTKVTIYWTPQSTSSRGTMYHSGGLALGGGLTTAGNLSVIGTSTFTGLATFDGNLTAPASTVNNSVSGSYQFRNSYGASLSSVGWYRFATSSTANNLGGTYMFFIRRSYTISNNEAYIISCIVDHGKVHWNLLNGHANTRLITQVRCTYTNDSTIYFDLYYNGSAQNSVYINAIGNCTLQVPTATSSTLTNTSTFGLGDGMIIDGNLLVKGGITMYATSSTSPITEFYASYLKVTGNMDIVGNINSTYYMLNNTVTNPYLKFTHTYNGANYVHYLQGYQGYLYLGAGSTNSIRISSDGSLYTPKTLTQGSDIRYKDVHKDLSLSLSTIAEAPSFEFNFKDDEQKSTHIGTSAQYWQSVNGVVTEDSEGRLGMDYSSLGVVMGISLARELSRFESDTERRIRLLEEENQILKNEIENLRKNK